MQKGKNRVVYLVLVMFLFFGLWSCNKDKNNNYQDIPNVYVNFYLQPDGIDFIPPNGWKIYDYEGYRGVLIYRIDQLTFNAYEMTCPFDAALECAKVQVDASGILLIDSCCMSTYNILDGMPAGGPTTLALKQYFTEYNGIQLHVYNTP